MVAMKLSRVVCAKIKCEQKFPNVHVSILVIKMPVKVLTGGPFLRALFKFSFFPTNVKHIGGKETDCFLSHLCFPSVFGHHSQFLFNLIKQ